MSYIYFVIGIIILFVVGSFVLEEPQQPYTEIPSPSYSPLPEEIDAALEKEIPKNTLVEVTSETETASNILFSDLFDTDEVIEETSDVYRYRHLRWWVNSGAYFYIENGVGKTIQGRLEADDARKIRYEPKGERTDGGFRPQNIFRLITNEQFDDATFELSFQIINTDTTDSVERAQSNGILLFGRYYDQDNLYYAGIRVDGNLVVKKKFQGEYTTLALRKVFDGTYSKEANSNLIPHNEWLTVLASYKTTDEGNVSITVSLDVNNDGMYDYTLSVLDDGREAGSAPYIEAGDGGIRTDFMDVTFGEFTAKSL